MKWLLLTTHQQAYAPQRLVEEIEKLGDSVVNAEYSQLTISFSSASMTVEIAGHDLLEFDAFIFRTPAQSAYAHFSFYPQRQALVEHLFKMGKRKVLNLELMRRGFEGMNKLTQTAVLVENKIPVIPSKNIGYYDKALQQEWEWPVIAKTIVGSHGSGVKKLLYERDLRYYLATLHPWKILFQPFLPTGKDFRVLVLGGKVVGAMQRSAKPGSFLTNVSAGGSFEQAEVTTEMEKIALKAAKAFKADYCGVDIMYDEDGKPSVLEVNDGAQFEGFETCTGINVAAKVVEYVAGKK